MQQQDQMQEKSEPNTFHKIIEEGNTLLEAGVIGEALQYRLTVTESVDVKNIYIGEITSLEDHMKLKEGFDSFEEVLELVRDSKNVKISLDDMSVTLVSHFEKKTEVAKVMLKKSEQGFVGLVSLDQIGRCNQKGNLDDDKIKRSFEILAKQIMQLKQQRKEIFESLKDEILGKKDKQNQQIQKKHKNIQQKQSNQIKLLKKQIEFVKINNEAQLTHMKQLQKGFEQNQCSLENSLKIEMDSLRQELSNLNWFFIQKIQQVKLQNKSNSIQNIGDTYDKSVSKKKEKQSASVTLNLKEPNVGKQDQLESVIVRCNQEFELKVRQTKTFFKILAEEMLTEKLDHQNIINVLGKEIDDLTQKSKLIYQKEMSVLREEIDTINEKSTKQVNDFVEFKTVIGANNKKIKEKQLKLIQQYQNQTNSLKSEMESIKIQTIYQNTNLLNSLRKEFSALNKQHNQQLNYFETFQNMVDQANQKTNQNHKQFTQKCQSEFLSLKNEMESICSQINTLKNNLQAVRKESGQTKERQQEFSKKCDSDFGLLRNSVKDIKTQNGKLKTDFELLQKKTEQNGNKCLNIENGFKIKAEELCKETKSLSDLLNNSKKMMQTMKEQNAKQFQKTQILQQKMVYLNVYVQNEKQIQQKQKQKYQLNIKFYKQQKYFKKFSFNGKTLTKVNDTQNGKTFVFLEQVLFDNQFKFSIKIVKSKQRLIAFGILDYGLFKQNKLANHDFIGYYIFKQYKKCNYFLNTKFYYFIQITNYFMHITNFINNANMQMHNVIGHIMVRYIQIVLRKEME